MKSDRKSQDFELNRKIESSGDFENNSNINLSKTPKQPCGEKKK